MARLTRTSLTGARAARAIEAIRRGATLRTAARAAGVTLPTLRKWLERGERETAGPYREFWLDVQAAYAEVERFALESILSAAQSDWRAASRILQHIERDTYVEKPSVTFDGVAPEEIVIKFPEEQE